MGAGASSKGKSPGSSAPQIRVPPQLGQIGQNTMNLGSYESQFINEPWSLGNWAMNIATGGTGPQVTQNPLEGGPQTGFFGTRSVPGGTVQTYGGGTAGAGAGAGTGAGAGSTRNPFGGGPGGGGSGNLPGEPNLPGILGGFSAGENAAWNTALTPPPGEAGIQSEIDQANQGAVVANTRANQLYNKGQWLTPQQEAMINQQTAANEAQVAQTEGSMGLAGSTQAAQLAGETALAGEATKGQLQQGNMQIAQGWTTAAQNWQRVAQGFTALGMTEQNQAFNQFTSIAQLSAAEQAQMFQEGTAGYQLMQTFMGSVLQPYGISLQAFNSTLQAYIAQVGDQVQLQSTAISADQQGQDQVISGISQVLSSWLSSFCWIAREVYGVGDPRWMQFRYWMLTRAPNWFRTFYLRYGERIAIWISNKPLLKRVIKLWMNWVIKHG